MTSTAPVAVAGIQSSQLNYLQRQFLDDVEPFLPHIPAGMHDAIIGWVLTARPTGSFLQALLSNDLMGAVGRADDLNQAAIAAWCRLLYNAAPAGSFGSPENVRAWAAHGGLQHYGDPA